MRIPTKKTANNVELIKGAPSLGACVLLPHLTFELHAHAEALVKSAGRTLLPGAGADGARGAAHAHVVLFVLYSPLEETFTRLTGEDAVVEA